MPRGKPSIVERCKASIVRRRADRQSPDSIAKYAATVVNQFKFDVALLHLNLPESVAFDRFLSTVKSRQDAKVVEGVRNWKKLATRFREVNLSKESLISTEVMIALSCSLIELNRWARDGRLVPDGERWHNMAGGSYRKRLRAWLPETVEAAKPRLAAWREQDAVKKQFGRRGLKIVGRR